jgi:NADH-ubiquinone oxidoreductase chain 3
MYKTIFFFFIPLLAFILLAVNYIFAPHNPYLEKDSVFECGFASFLGQNRTQFSISFFIFALLFLLFDLEILLVYPYIVSGYNNSIYGLGIMLLFILILTSGFAFELGKKALNIESRQVVVTTNKEETSTTINHNVININTLSPRSINTLNRNSNNLKNRFINFIAKVFTLKNILRIVIVFSLSLLCR